MKTVQYRLVINVPDNILHKDIKECILEALKEFGGKFLPDDPKWYLFRGKVEVFSQSYKKATTP